MVTNTSRQHALFYAPLDRQASLIKDDLLEPIDQLLDDSELVDLVRSRLENRRRLSARTGRPAIAPDRLLRCCVLKHLKAWSFRELERELRCNLVYRRFTRFDADPTPDFTTLSRNFALLGEGVMQAIHERIVLMGKANGVVAGAKLRVDTTVVETNIHHPTDSTLLADGVRVLTRTLKRIAKECEPATMAVVDHARAVKRRVLEITRAARGFTDSSKQRMKESYQGLVKLTEGVLEQATGVIEGADLVVVGSMLKVGVLIEQLRHFAGLVAKVIEQTRQRVFEGNRFVADKVLSLFEPHTQVIRKGKAHKPTEFGRLVRIDEVENGVISHIEVLKGNPADTTSWEPALRAHVDTFRRPPRMATADRGFFSAANERIAKKKFGVKRVGLPVRGRLSQKRRSLQKSRWFRRVQKWRSGVEARIATLKHRFGMARARYKGAGGFDRYVQWCTISHNLVSIARTSVRRSMRGSKNR
jgi:IS5 family transposase